MDWLDLLAVQGTLKSLLQHHSSKASVLQGSTFFIVQLSYPYMTTGKTIALTRRTFVDRVMSLLFNMLFNNLFKKHILICFIELHKQHLCVPFLCFSLSLLLHPYLPHNIPLMVKWLIPPTYTHIIFIPAGRACACLLN